MNPMPHLWFMIVFGALTLLSMPLSETSPEGPCLFFWAVTVSHYVMFMVSSDHRAISPHRLRDA